MDFKDIAEKRRAINFFDPEKELSQETLTHIVEMAAKAPSGFNIQPWRIMALRAQEEKLKLQKVAWNQPKVSEAPVTLIVLADTVAFKEGNENFETFWEKSVATGSMQSEQRDWLVNAADSLYGNSRDASLAFGVKNAAFFAMSLMYAATSLGVESHPMDGFDQQGVKEAFKIPDNYWVTVLISLGYLAPDRQVTAPKWRKSFQETLIFFA